MERDRKEREEEEKKYKSRVQWLLKKAGERTYMDPVLASTSIRD
jgi:hypothetical protein